MPLYSDHVLDEVRSAVNIVSLVSEYVALKKRGRNHVARCPFHTEKTPSFNVSEEKQIFMCFGCGLGGDVFRFVMQIEHLSFPEAVRFIAERHGIALPEIQASAPAVPTSSTDVLRKVMAETVALFHRLLLDSHEGNAALKYLLDRGVTRETIAQFHLGYSPAGGDALIQVLKSKGFPLQAMEECGLVKRSDDGSRSYDNFRDRIMFPITDIQGRPVAFGARAMGDKQPKYLNSPETKLYNKSRNLYGLSFSKEAIKARDQAILVEGYMDFVVPFQSGVQNLVASLGTSLTPQQVELLGRYTREVVVSYDPDSAGLAATQRSLDLFLEGDFQVKVLRLPAGQDPDVFVRTSGAEEYHARARESVPYLEFVLEAAIQKQGALDDPKKKVQVVNTVLPYLAKLPSAVERSDYVFLFARRLGIEDQQLLAETKRAAQQKRVRLADEPVASALSMKLAEKRLLQFLLNDADLQLYILPLCTKQDFEGLASEKIFSILMDGFNRNQLCTYDSLHGHFAGDAEQALLAQLEIEEVPESPSRATAESSLYALRTMRLAAFKQKILSEIAEAAARNDDAMLTHLFEQRVLVDRELISLSRK
ncbi:MAG TPA: DNA primase [Acidobacteriota bacterium]|nr:DNA primase [Acidobacteriota bacterium]